MENYYKIKSKITNNSIPIKVKLVKSNQNQNQSHNNISHTLQNNNHYNKLQTSPKKKIAIDNKNKLCNSSSKILDEEKMER